MNAGKFFVLMLVFSILSGCTEKKKEKPDKNLIPVKVLEIKQEPQEKVLQFSGNILPFKTIKFGFMVAGKISEIHITEGQYVQKGDPIANIDPTDYNFALAASKAQYTDASKEYKRLKALYEKGSLTLSDYDKITALYHEAKADYDYKTKQVNDTRLFAPDDGWIAVEGVEAGEIVPQGMPLFGLVHTKIVFAETGIPEGEINQVKLGDPVKVRVPALNDKCFTGKVSRISPFADPYSRSFTIKASIDNNDFVLKPGMIAFVNLPTGEEISNIVIPSDAINIDGNGHTYVFTYDSGKAHRVIIRTGRAIEDGVEIISGLKAGDSIITEGRIKLYEGAPVEIK